MWPSETFRLNSRAYISFVRQNWKKQKMIVIWVERGQAIGDRGIEYNWSNALIVQSIQFRCFELCFHCYYTVEMSIAVGAFWLRSFFRTTHWLRMNVYVLLSITKTFYYNGHERKLREDAWKSLTISPIISCCMQNSWFISKFNLMLANSITLSTCSVSRWYHFIRCHPKLLLCFVFFLGSFRTKGVCKRGNKKKDGQNAVLGHIFHIPSSLS